MKLLLPLVISLGMTTQAIADDAVVSQSVDQSGFWVGAGIGMGIVDNKNDLLSSIVVAEALSSKLEFGYDFNRYFGIYTNYDYMNYLGDTDLHLGTLGVKSNYYFTTNLSAFGKLGVTYMMPESGNKVFTNGFTGSVGFGLEYQLNNAVSTKIGYDYRYLELKQGTDSDLQQIYWGMTYKFGQPDTPLIVTRNIDVVVEVIKEIPVEVVKEVIRSKYVLPFQFNQVAIGDYASYNLNEIAQTLKDNPKLTIDIIGRANSIGTAEVNDQISKARANTVYQYFIDNGIDIDRLTVISVSDEDPLTDNSQSVIERSVEVIVK